jgi:alpha-amylase
LANEECFAADVNKQVKKIEEYIGKKPTVLLNSSLIYIDDIGAHAAVYCFKGMLTE